MIRKFEKHLKKIVTPSSDHRYLLAISGGMDSVVLAHLCHEIGLSFDFCHVNYHLRGASSDADADFVSDLAASLGVKLFLLDYDMSSYEGNIQLEARNARYDWFDELTTKKGYAYLLTAHHLNDSVETHLFNLGRGTGIDGLLGIPSQNEYIIRPLALFAKADIIAFANAHDILHREDLSNQSDKYARNFLRHHIVPRLEQHNPNYLSGVQNTMTHLQGTAYFSKLAMDSILENALQQESETRWRIAKNQVYKNAFPSTLFYHWLSPYGFTGKQLADFFETDTWQNGASLLADSWKLIYDRGHFILAQTVQLAHTKVAFNPHLFQELDFNGYRFHISFIDKADYTPPSDHTTAYFAADDLSLLTLRHWASGDTMRPHGMQGKSKKIKKLFTDEKYDIDQKHKTPILLSRDRILWVVGLRTSESFKVDDHTTRILKVRFELYP